MLDLVALEHTYLRKYSSVSDKYFCTLFDKNYLIKGVAMIRSLMANCQNAYIYVLCMDEQTQVILEELFPSQIKCIPLADIETEELLKAKSDRGTAEYCWTLSPCLPWYIFSQYPEVSFITYLDADLFFYSSVEPIFQEIGSKSIAIIEHRFSPRLKDRVVNGRFCVEWVSFRRDEEGMACLSLWREQCIDWCYYRLEEDRMGDQKYLDNWPALYQNCHIISNVGAGVAPWNYEQYRFTFNPPGEITVDGAPLIFYHFHQFQILLNGGFDRVSSFYTSEQSIPEPIYCLYESKVAEILEELIVIDPKFSGGLQKVSSTKLRRLMQKFCPRLIRELLHKLIGY